MWCQSGLDPERFWEQTPYHFQLVMRGIRKRLTSESEDRLRQAWWGGAFAGLTQSKGGLKPLDHYLRRPSQARMKPKTMLDAFHSMKAQGMPMTIRRVRRRKAREQERADHHG